MYSRAHLDPGPIVTDNRSILFGTPEKKQGELPLWEGLAYVEAFIAKHSNLPIVNFTDHAIFAAAAKNLLMPDPYPIWWGWLDFPNIMHFSWQSRLDFIRKFRPLIVAHVAFEETYGPFLQNNNYIIAKKFGEIVVLVDAHLSLY